MGQGTQGAVLQADLMTRLVTRISISSLRGLMGQDFNPRSKIEFPSFKSWVEVKV